MRFGSSMSAGKRDKDPFLYPHGIFRLGTCSYGTGTRIPAWRSPGGAGRRCFCSPCTLQVSTASYPFSQFRSFMSAGGSAKCPLPGLKEQLQAVILVPMDLSLTTCKGRSIGTRRSSWTMLLSLNMCENVTFLCIWNFEASWVKVAGLFALSPHSTQEASQDFVRSQVMSQDIVSGPEIGPKCLTALGSGFGIYKHP